jgi:3-hydroxyisobutyrate dehydrogenase-like beta-hydroxyacid dehydrogenase
MSLKAVAILAPGDMGHAVGAVLRQGGLRVISNLAGRSPLTADRARRAGIDAVADDATLVREADIVLSIVPPAEALGTARRVAAAMRTTGAKPLYADCNAIAPPTAREIGEIITGAGAPYVDAGIIGQPPKIGQKNTRIYASGPAASRLAALSAHGLDVRVVDGGIGAASALKMCYASMTKGLLAVMAEAFITAERLGVSAPLRAEMQMSNADTLRRAESGLPTVTYKAYRWVAEMEEIAATFADAGLTPQMFQGAAEVFQFIADSPLGRMTTDSPAISLDAFVAALAEAAARKEAAE